MESNITKILIKKFRKRCVTLPWIAHMRYGLPFYNIVLWETDEDTIVQCFNKVTLIVGHVTWQALRDKTTPQEIPWLLLPA